MSHFIKDEIQGLPGPLQTLPIELLEVNTTCPNYTHEGCRGPVESLKLLYIDIRVYKNAHVFYIEYFSF